MPRANIQQFRAALDTSKALIRKRLDLVVQETGLRIMENVVIGGDYGPGSPQDTGFFRSQWLVGVNDFPALPAERTGRKRAADEEGPLYAGGMPNGMTLALAGLKAGDRMFGVNNTVYGPPLEHGHSQQAPSPPGIVRGVLAQGQAIVSAVVRDVVERDG